MVGVLAVASVSCALLTVAVISVVGGMIVVVAVILLEVEVGGEKEDGRMKKMIAV